MSDWPIGLSTGCFYQRSIFDCIDVILAGGFSLIEVCSSPTHLDYHDLNAVRRAASLLESLGISACSFHAPFADRIDITSPEAQLREASIREVIAAAEAASILGARYFVIHPGPEQHEQPMSNERLQRLDNVARSLSEISSRCQALGTTCLLENKLPHLLFGNTANLLWILGAMDSTDAGVCLDTGHAHLADELDTAAQKLSRHLRLVHASDNNGHYDDHLPPGQGRINWHRFVRLLHESGFHGSIILEIAGRGGTEEILQAARRARRFLRSEAWRV